MLTQPWPSMPMTPALAPGQHRLGEAAAAVDDVARAHDVVALRAQLVRHAVEGLAEMGEIALRLAHRHAHIEVAGRHGVGGADQAADRRHQPVGEVEPDPHRRQQHDQRDHRVHQREGDLHAEPARFQRRVFGDALARRLQLRHHARIEQPRDVEIIVREFVDLDHGGDVVGVGQQHDLRLGRRDMRQRLARRQREGLVHLGLGARDDLEVLVEDDGGGEPAHGGLEGEELRQLGRLGIEQRLGARQVEAHHHDVGAHDLRVIVQIGFGDDQRVLDRRAGAGREQAVEAAVERDAGHDRHQDRGRRGDEREQADDAHVQPRRGAAGAPRLHHLPDLANDDGDQQDHRRRIGEQQADHDVMGRGDGGQIGEDDEGDEGRQQRQADGDRPEHARLAPPRRRGRQRGFGGSLIDAHCPPAADRAERNSGTVRSRSAPRTLMLLYNNVAELRRFRGQWQAMAARIGAKPWRSQPTMSRTSGMTLRP